MSFQTLGFLLFLVLTTAVCLAVGRKSREAATFLLTAASALFCLLGHNGGRSLAVIAVGCAVTMLAVRHMKKRVFIAVCLYHIAVLVAFKYTAFLTGGAVSMGWTPIGISFFTFQQLWLLKEVYTGQFVPEAGDSIPLLALFFPTLTSGPILRPTAFFPQLRGEKFLRPEAQDIAAAVYAICCGTVKKVLLADPLGGIVNNGWARIGELTAPSAWLVMLAYTLQLYLDFSGYCDIASGCARLLGLRLPVNFDSPYRALSVTNFWKRWHITLTTFLRECVYFPLGGSRKGAVRAYLNILIVFLVSGIWHGAGWTFIVWGLLHGLAQVIERLLGEKRNILPKAVQWVLTFAFINLAWVFFRAPDMASAVELLKAAVAGPLAMPQKWLTDGVLAKEVGAVQILLPQFKAWLPRIVTGGLVGGGLLASLLPGNTIRRMESFRPNFWQALWLSVLTAWAVLSFSGVATFIYSNF